MNQLPHDRSHDCTLWYNAHLSVDIAQFTKTHFIYQLMLNVIYTPDLGITSLWQGIWFPLNIRHLLCMSKSVPLLLPAVVMETLQGSYQV